MTKVEELLAAARAAVIAGQKRMQFDAPVCWRRPKGFPRVEVMCVNYAGRVMYSADPVRMIKFLEGVVPQAGARPLQPEAGKETGAAAPA